MSIFDNVVFKAGTITSLAALSIGDVIVARPYAHPAISVPIVVHAERTEKPRTAMGQENDAGRSWEAVGELMNVEDVIPYLRLPSRQSLRADARKTEAARSRSMSFLAKNMVWISAATLGTVVALSPSDVIVARSFARPTVEHPILSASFTFQRAEKPVARKPIDDRALWTRLYGRELPDEELMEIRENLTRFGRLMAEQAQMLAQDPNWKRNLDEHATATA